MKNHLKRKLAKGETVFGVFWETPAAALVEVAAAAGVDFIVIDQEHGAHSYETVEHLVRAGELHGLTSIVRASGTTEGELRRPLDVGAGGVLVPHVTRREQAEEVVRTCRYAPEGERGVNPFTRASGFGSQKGESLFREANEEVLLGVQIEGVAGVENLDEILTVVGIDIIFLGPYDLSQSVGRLGQVGHPEVVAMMEEVIDRVRASGRTPAIYADTPADARFWRDRHVPFIAVQADVFLFYRACCELMEAVRQPS